MANTATLFVLALAGGFLFAYLCHYTSYLASRVEGQRLVFFTAGYAVGLLVWSRLALIVPLLTFRDCWLAAISDVWKFAVGPVHHPALATFFGAFVWAPILAWGVNRIYPYDRASDRAIEKYGGDTERLLSRYITNTELVSITLDNRKVYIGWPTYTPSLRRETEDFRLLPVLSGYRGEKTLELRYTTYYADILDQVEEGEVQSIDTRDLEVVIPLEEITSLGPYSLNIPQDAFRLPSEQPKPTRKSGPLHTLLTLLIVWRITRRPKGD
jgi:hypothetical protein